LLGNASFPLTKADIIHRANRLGAPVILMVVLSRLPSRLYRCRDEVVNLCICRSAGCTRPIAANREHAPVF
jgi:hypothetical protein